MLSLIPNWQILKAIGGSRTVALAGFFPFVGYLFLANQELSQNLSLVIDMIDGQVNHDAVADRLHQMYFGMLFLSAGVILYRIFCPPEISGFADRYDFMEREMAIMTPTRVGLRQMAMSDLVWWNVLFLNKELLEQIRSVKDHRFGSAEIKDMSHPIHIDKKAQKSAENYRSDEGIGLLQMLNTYFDLKNHSAGPLRICIAAAFLTGYSKLAWPSLVVAWQLFNA